MIDVPEGLDGPGADMWREVTGTYKLRFDERRVLEDACRTMNIIDRLQDALGDSGLTSRGSMGQEVINPIYTELRQQRSALNAMWRQLKLPDVDGSAAGKDQSSEAGRSLVALRWGN